jgi:hypothetical protein
MNVKKLLIASVVVGVVLNVFDAVVQGQLMAPTYAKLSGLFRTDMNMAYLVIGDFVAALVFVWVYDKVRGSFGAGAAGGAVYGLYAGVLMNFPTWIFLNMLIVGFPYSLAWIWTLIGVVATVIAGAVAGALYK